MIVIGLTGSIGMGKTTVAGMFKDHDIPVHDADLSVHHLLATGGKAVAQVAALAPEALAQDDQGQDYIDRQILGRIVFADRAKKRQLEEILHPMVRAESDAFIADMRARGMEMAVLDIPLLFETQGQNRVDVTVCVTALHDTQRSRVLARPGMTSEKFDRIVAGQLPDAEKQRLADYVIDTEKGLDETRRQVEELISTLREKVLKQEKAQ